MVDNFAPAAIFCHFLFNECLDVNESAKPINNAANAMNTSPITTTGTLIPPPPPPTKLDTSRTPNKSDLTLPLTPPASPVKARGNQHSRRSPPSPIVVPKHSLSPQPLYPSSPSTPPHYPQQRSTPPTSPTKPINGNGIRPTHRRRRSSVDYNAINQEHPYYVDLRDRATAEGEAMQLCLSISQVACLSNDFIAATRFADRALHHRMEMERFNAEASEWIFNANNEHRELHEVDLHGLSVKEAIAYAELALMDGVCRADDFLHFIVGRGLHSKGGISRLKPAIQALVQAYQMLVHVHPTNEGILIVHLKSRPTVQDYQTFAMRVQLALL